jgi:hypothetical protein
MNIKHKQYYYYCYYHHYLLYAGYLYIYSRDKPCPYIVAAILSLLFMVPISPVPALAVLYFYVSEVCVQGPILLFAVVP